MLSFFTIFVLGICLLYCIALLRFKINYMLKTAMIMCLSQHSFCVAHSRGHMLRLRGCARMHKGFFISIKYIICASAHIVNICALFCRKKIFVVITKIAILKW